MLTSYVESIRTIHKTAHWPADRLHGLAYDFIPRSLCLFAENNCETKKDNNLPA